MYIQKQSFLRETSQTLKERRWGITSSEFNVDLLNISIQETHEWFCFYFLVEKPFWIDITKIWV